MPFLSQNTATVVVSTFSAATATRGDSKEFTECSPPVMTSPTTPSSPRRVMVVMIRAITVSLLLAMQLVMMDAAVLTFHALSSNPALLGLGLLTLLGSTGLMIRGIVSELKTDLDSRSELHQAAFLVFLGQAVGNVGHGCSTHSASVLSYWLHLAVPSSSIQQTNAMAAMIISVWMLGLMVLLLELDAYHVLLAVAAAPTILPIWYLGGVTPAAVQQELMIPSGAWITLGGLGAAIGSFRLAIDWRNAC